MNESTVQKKKEESERILFAYLTAVAKANNAKKGCLINLGICLLLIFISIIYFFLAQSGNYTNFLVCGGGIVWGFLFMVKDWFYYTKYKEEAENLAKVISG